MIFMNRMILFLGAVALLSSCNIDELFHDVTYEDLESESTQEPSVQVRDFTLSQVLEGESGQETLKVWKDSVTFSLIETPPEVGPGDIGINWGEDDFEWKEGSARLYESVEYNLPKTRMRLTVYPEDMQLKGLSLSSSDTTILKITPGDSYYDFNFEPRGVGCVSVYVSVDNGRDVLRKTYKIQVRATVTANVYIDAFWTNPSLCKVRYRMTGVPENLGPIVFSLRDSLAIDADCYWTDVRAGVYEEQRDVCSYEYPVDSWDRIYRPDRRQLIRSFKDAMFYFQTKYRFGTEFIGDTDRITEVRYDYYPVHARLYLDVFSNSEYIDFKSVVQLNQDVFSVDDFEDDSDVGVKSDPMALEHLDLFFRKDVDSQEDSIMTSNLKTKLSEVRAGAGDPAWIDEILHGLSEDEREEYLYFIR